MKSGFIDTFGQHVDAVYISQKHVHETPKNRHIVLDMGKIRRNIDILSVPRCSTLRPLFNDLPPLPPRPDIETRTVLKACIRAQASLATLRGVAGRIPNQGMLINIVPMWRHRPARKSRISSQRRIGSFNMPARGQKGWRTQPRKKRYATVPPYMKVMNLSRRGH